MQQSYGIKPRLFKTQNVKSRHFSAPPIYNFIGPRPGLGWAGLGRRSDICSVSPHPWVLPPPHPVQGSPMYTPYTIHTVAGVGLVLGRAGALRQVGLCGVMMLRCPLGANQTCKPWLTMSRKESTVDTQIRQQPVPSPWIVEMVYYHDG